MSAAVICQGCGQPVAVPEDYRRNKIQCPACGVICPVPAGAVVCVSCGFHLRKRKKLVKEYQPIRRRWETNYPLRPRLALFLVLWSLTLATHVIGLSLTGGV